MSIHYNKYNKQVFDEGERLRKLKLQSELKQDNSMNIGIMKMIEGKDPKYAKHIMKKNNLVMQFAMKLFGGVELLEQPVCPACEIPASWNDNASGYCFTCHRTIPPEKVVTVREYLLDQVKGMTEEEIELLNMLGGD